MKNLAVAKKIYGYRKRIIVMCCMVKYWLTQLTESLQLQEISSGVYHINDKGYSVPVDTRQQGNAWLHIVAEIPQPEETLWFIGDAGKPQYATEVRKDIL